MNKYMLTVVSVKRNEIAWYQLKKKNFRKNMTCNEAVDKNMAESNNYVNRIEYKSLLRVRAALI